MNFFSLGRLEGFPARYAAQKTPVFFDTVEVIVITIFVILILAFVCIIPSYSKKHSFSISIKVILSLLIGLFLVVENFGQEWEVGTIRSKVPYKAGCRFDIDSLIGIKIGLRSVNITLKRVDTNDILPNEIIDYNERFPWTWDQGRFGFGPHSGLIQRSLRSAQRKGLPIPILWIAEYFTIDGEGIRFGRFYRTAGWYCHILLWAAFSCWIIANIMLQSVSRYTAYFLALAGGLQLLTVLLWSMMHNEIPLVIPFESGVLTLQYGLHFYMTLVCGTLCIIIALIILYMDLRHPNILSEFLGIDPFNQYDECVLRPDEIKNITLNKKVPHDSIEMNEMPSTSNSNMSSMKNDGMVSNGTYTSRNIESHSPVIEVQHQIFQTKRQNFWSEMLMKRRSSIKQVQKSLFRKPVPVKFKEYEEIAVYQNQSILH